MGKLNFSCFSSSVTLLLGICLAYMTFTDWLTDRNFIFRNLLTLKSFQPVQCVQSSPISHGYYLGMKVSKKVSRYRKTVYDANWEVVHWSWVTVACWNKLEKAGTSWNKHNIIVCNFCYLIFGCSLKLKREKLFSSCIILCGVPLGTYWLADFRYNGFLNWHPARSCWNYEM